MTKIERKHREQLAAMLEHVATMDGSERIETEKKIQELRARIVRNAQRRERDQAMRDLGLVKVRGAMGGTYYE